MDFILDLDCSEYISRNVSDIKSRNVSDIYNIKSKLKYINSTSVFDMHLINEIDCYFSSLKVIFDIDFFGAGCCLFLFAYLLCFCSIFVFLDKIVFILRLLFSAVNTT